MMSTESANSFTLIGEASDGGTMENLSRRLKVKSTDRRLVSLHGSYYFEQTDKDCSCNRLLVSAYSYDLNVESYSSVSESIPPR